MPEDIQRSKRYVVTVVAYKLVPQSLWNYGISIDEVSMQKPKMQKEWECVERIIANIECRVQARRIVSLKMSSNNYIIKMTYAEAKPTMKPNLPSTPYALPIVSQEMETGEKHDKKGGDNADECRMRNSTGECIAACWTCPATSQRCILLGCIQSEFQGTVGLKVPRSSGRFRAPVVPQMQCTSSLHQRCIWMILLVRIDIPDHRRRCPINDSIGGPHRILIAIVANSVHREMCWRR